MVVLRLRKFRTMTESTILPYNVLNGSDFQLMTIVPGEELRPRED